MAAGTKKFALLHAKEGYKNDQIKNNVLELADIVSNLERRPRPRHTQVDTKADVKYGDFSANVSISSSVSISDLYNSYPLHVKPVTPTSFVPIK